MGMEEKKEKIRKKKKRKKRRRKINKQMEVLVDCLKFRLTVLYV